MKNRSAIFTLFLTALLSITTMTAAPNVLAEEKLIAPPYPGATRVTPPNAKGREHVLFRTVDPHKKVETYYRALGIRPAAANEISVKSDHSTTLVVFSTSESMKLLKQVHGLAVYAGPARVFLEWPAGEGMINFAYEQFFMNLENEAKRHTGHSTELAQVKSTYDWLHHSRCDDAKVQMVLDRCTNESLGAPPAVNDPKAVKALSDQMAQLAKEGKFAELAEISKKLTPAAANSGESDKFGLWKTCLSEAAGFAWLTEISIDQNPTLWSY